MFLWEPRDEGALSPWGTPDFPKELEKGAMSVGARQILFFWLSQTLIPVVHLAAVLQRCWCVCPGSILKETTTAQAAACILISPSLMPPRAGNLEQQLLLESKRLLPCVPQQSRTSWLGWERERRAPAKNLPGKHLAPLYKSLSRRHQLLLFILMEPERDSEGLSGHARTTLPIGDVQVGNTQCHLCPCRQMEWTEAASPLYPPSCSPPDHLWGHAGSPVVVPQCSRAAHSGRQPVGSWSSHSATASHSPPPPRHAQHGSSCQGWREITEPGSHPH